MPKIIVEHEGKNHQIQLQPTQVSKSFIEGQIKKVWGLNFDEFHLSYLDADQDQITVDIQEDFQVAKQTMIDGQNDKLVFYLTLNPGVLPKINHQQIKAEMQKPNIVSVQTDICKEQISNELKKQNQPIFNLENEQIKIEKQTNVQKQQKNEKAKQNILSEEQIRKKAELQEKKKMEAEAKALAKQKAKQQAERIKHEKQQAKKEAQRIKRQQQQRKLAEKKLAEQKRIQQKKQMEERKLAEKKLAEEKKLMQKKQIETKKISEEKPEAKKIKKSQEKLKNNESSAEQKIQKKEQKKQKTQESFVTETRVRQLIRKQVIKMIPELKQKLLENAPQVELKAESKGEKKCDVVGKCKFCSHELKVPYFYNPELHQYICFSCQAKDTTATSFIKIKNPHHFEETVFIFGGEVKKHTLKESQSQNLEKYLEEIKVAAVTRVKEDLKLKQLQCKKRANQQKKRKQQEQKKIEKQLKKEEQKQKQKKEQNSSVEK